MSTKLSREINAHLLVLSQSQTNKTLLFSEAFKSQEYHVPTIAKENLKFRTELLKSQEEHFSNVVGYYQ